MPEHRQSLDSGMAHAWACPSPLANGHDVIFWPSLKNPPLPNLHRLVVQRGYEGLKFATSKHVGPMSAVEDGELVTLARSKARLTRRSPAERLVASREQAVGTFPRRDLVSSTWHKRVRRAQGINAGDAKGYRWLTIGVPATEPVKIIGVDWCRNAIDCSPSELQAGSSQVYHWWRFEILKLPQPVKQVT